MTPSGTQLGTDVHGPRALYFGDIYQDAASISHKVASQTRLRFELFIAITGFQKFQKFTKQSLDDCFRMIVCLYWK